MPTLTKKQKQILDFVKVFIKKNGLSPTFEEIGRYTKKTFSTVHEHVEALITKGFLSKINNSSRGIQLIEQSEMVKIPLLGTIAAGQPIEALQEREIIAIPKDKFTQIHAAADRGDGLSVQMIDQLAVDYFKSLISKKGSEKLRLGLKQKISKLKHAVETVVNREPARFIIFFNKAQPLSMRMHQLELLPGLGKKHMWEVLEARKEKPFESFEDIKNRVKLLPDPKSIIIKRILSEIEGKEKYQIFVG